MELLIQIIVRFFFTMASVIYKNGLKMEKKKIENIKFKINMWLGMIFLLFLFIITLLLSILYLLYKLNEKINLLHFEQKYSNSNQTYI